MVGIVAGTYSSICLASGFWFVLRNKFVPKEREEDEEKYIYGDVFEK